MKNYTLLLPFFAALTTTLYDTQAIIDAVREAMKQTVTVNELPR